MWELLSFVSLFIDCLFLCCLEDLRIRICGQLIKTWGLYRSISKFGLISVKCQEREKDSTKEFVYFQENQISMNFATPTIRPVSTAYESPVEKFSVCSDSEHNVQQEKYLEEQTLEKSILQQYPVFLDPEKFEGIL